MPEFNRKSHWENIYQTKNLEDVSWYQPVPEISLDLISSLNPTLNASIIDIGGGDSFLIDNLLKQKFEDLSVLDISGTAIEKAKKRIGGSNVKWIETDVLEFVPNQKYDIWHDRAAFHFLTEDHEVAKYLELVKNSINVGGYLIIGTFSTDGPLKCSGINIRQYSETSMEAVFGSDFTKIKVVSIEHKTPFDTIQNFVFGVFKKN